MLRRFSSRCPGKYVPLCLVGTKSAFCGQALTLARLAAADANGLLTARAAKQARRAGDRAGLDRQRPEAVDAVVDELETPEEIAANQGHDALRGKV